MHKKIGPYKGTRSGFSAIRSRIPADGSPSFVKPVVEDEKRGRAVYQEMAEVVSAECERQDSLRPGVAQHFAGVSLPAESVSYTHLTMRTNPSPLVRRVSISMSGCSSVLRFPMPEQCR